MPLPWGVSRGWASAASPGAFRKAVPVSTPRLGGRKRFRFAHQFHWLPTKLVSRWSTARRAMLRIVALRPAST